MAVKFRDYYEVLGVDRAAGADEIRKAFRKLARKYHPDVAEDKARADEKFKEINEAYEVLSDPEKRKKYDALGPDWQHMGDFAGAGGPGYAGTPGGAGFEEFHFDGTGFSDFFEHLFGRRSSRGGFGGFADMGGMGGRRGRTVQMRGRDVEAELLVTLPELMHGAERVLTLRRPGPTGRSEKADTVKVKIPRGIAEGQLIRCAGLGEPGINGGENGDLFLRVIIQRHPEIRVRGYDLHMDLALAPWEAVLGSKVPISTPHGSIHLTIPAGTTTGTELRLKGKGLPTSSHGNTFGDLFVHVHIEVPETVNDAERSLWEQLAKQSSFQPRKP